MFVSDFVIFRKRYLMASFLPILLVLGFGSCSGEKTDYSSQEIWEMASKEYPDITLILPDKEFPAVDCKDYGPGCMYGHTVKIKDLYFISIRFSSPEEALISAKRINGLYFANWVFDDVLGEPVLEDFVKKVYGAKRPFLPGEETGAGSGK